MRIFFDQGTPSGIAQVHRWERGAPGILEYPRMPRSSGVMSK